MKKYLMMGAAAISLCATFTSCSKEKDLYDPATAKQQIIENYDQAFVNTFGQPAPDQTWGFGSAAGARLTRAITVNGDTYSKFPSTSDVAANFPTAIPEDAKEVSGLLDEYKGKEVPTQWGTTTLWDIYAIYANVVKEGFNLKITQAGTTELGGNYQNAGWNGSAGRNEAYPYNVYVNVPEGKVTLKRIGATHFNLYILSGEVTLGADYGEQAGIISVAEGATLIDQRNSIAANQGVKIFNRGTVNATNTEKYDIGNYCTVYNEGKFNVAGPLTYSPADGNGSYFVNFGDDAELTAPAMTLNSTGNFFNDGKVTIAGETNVTQKDIYWVNAGHYTTGSLTFSAKNATFYNYCQLIVNGNAHMYDGEFNLMPNSYTEAGTAEMDNFIVNLGGNTGMNIKGAVDVKAQGDGTFQGFKNFGTNNYVLIGGKTTVASHRNTFSVEPGITYSVKEFEIVKGGSVVTEAYLQEIGDGDYPVLDLRGTGAPFGELTVTPNATGCGAVWSRGTTYPKLRVMAEDLSATEASDFDFNDVVMDVEYVSPDQVKITLQAAGGTLPLRINEDDNWEVHRLFQVSTGTIVNTYDDDYYHGAPCVHGKAPVELTLNGRFSSDENTFYSQVRSIKLEVWKTSNGVEQWVEMTAQRGEPAKKVGVPTTFSWATEGQNVNSVFNMTDWVKGAALAPAN